MKNITVTKMQRVENQDAEMLEMGIVAFQLVKIEIVYFGKKMENTYDTKIMADGKQFVIDGDGFIKDGFEIN